MATAETTSPRYSIRRFGKPTVCGGWDSGLSSKTGTPGSGGWNVKSRFIQGVAATLIVAVLPAQSFATEPFAKVGTYALQFLKIGVSARGAAMGGAFTAIAND